MAHVAKLSRSEIGLLVLSLFVIPLMMVEKRATEPTHFLWAWAANALIWLLFVAEYAWSWHRSSDRRQYAQKRWFELLIILLTIPIYLPAELHAVRGLWFLRFLQLGRAAGTLRLLRVAAALLRAWHHMGNILHRTSFLFLASSCAFVVVGGGALFVIAEQEAGHTFTDGLWWAVVTLTTIGYGDLYPVTGWGRVLAILIGFVGIGIVGAMVGNIYSYFVGEAESTRAEVAATREDRLQQELVAIRNRLERIESRLTRPVRKRRLRLRPALRQGR